METVTLSSKYQLVVPKAARERLGLRPGMRITVVGKGDVLFLVPQRAVRKARGLARGTRVKGLREKKDRH
jgi:AbrB family looped-hinge helix DNA binding protein